jgi:hypothetical protein
MKNMEFFSVVAKNATVQQVYELIRNVVVSKMEIAEKVDKK